jgi:arylsulfatase A-like enzyme
VPGFKRAPSVSEEAKQHPFFAYMLAQSVKYGNYRADIYPRDDKSMRQLRATYYGLITEVDHNIGKIIAQLKEADQYENTVIIFVSDHGAQIGDHHLLAPGAFFDQSFHVPLVIRSPDENMPQHRGRVVDAFTESVDILPTVMDMFGAEIPRQCDGRSLAPFLKGEDPKTWRNEAHWEVDFRYMQPSWGYEPPDEKLGIEFEECTFNVIRDENYKYVHFAALPPLFFDLKNDPDELHNLAQDPAYTDLMLSYAQKLISWRMANDERTLTHLMVGPNGVVEKPGN